VNVEGLLFMDDMIYSLDLSSYGNALLNTFAWNLSTMSFPHTDHFPSMTKQ